MLKFEKIEDATRAFRNGDIEPSDTKIEIAGMVYQYQTSSNIPFKHIVTGKDFGYLVYIVIPKHRDQIKEKNMREWMVFVYKKMKPIKILMTSRARHNRNLNREESMSNIVERDATNNRDVIGETMELRFTNLPSSNILKGKVDTGADISSLHCDNYDIDKASNRITFSCSHLSNNNITLPLNDIQAVKTADGVKNRPVIELSIKVGDKVIENVKFNLKNRADMEHPVLIGQNILDAGKFLIDPSKESIMEDQKLETHDVDWEHLSMIARSIPDSVVDDLLPNPDEDRVETNVMDDINDEVDVHDEMHGVDHDEDIHSLVEILRKSDISFSDIITHLESSDIVDGEMSPVSDELSTLDR